MRLQSLIVGMERIMGWLFGRKVAANENAAPAAFTFGADASIVPLGPDRVTFRASVDDTDANGGLLLRVALTSTSDGFSVAEVNVPARKRDELVEWAQKSSRIADPRTQAGVAVGERAIVLTCMRDPRDLLMVGVVLMGCLEPGCSPAQGRVHVDAQQLRAFAKWVEKAGV